MPPDDVTALRIDIKTVVSIIAAVLTVAGLYYGITSKLDLHTKEVEALNRSLASVAEEQKEVQRAVIELIATLKAKEVIR